MKNFLKKRALKSRGARLDLKHKHGVLAPTSGTRGLRLGLLGSTGKMGRKLSSLLIDDAELRDVWLHVYSVSGPQDPNFDSLRKADVDVVIDFSAPQASLAMAKLCAELKVPMLICTTGFTPEQMKTLERTLAKVPWGWAPNTSLGVYALKQVLKKALAVLPKEYSFEIIDIHHQHKKDAPSGTAKLLLSEIAASEHATHDVLSMRGGSEVGEHRIVILGPDERLELSHHAQDRMLFARGALKLAQKLVTLKARSSAYTVDELFQ